MGPYQDWKEKRKHSYSVVTAQGFVMYFSQRGRGCKTRVIDLE
jgi:hypothetical protein